jgi:hypothetical protein
VLFPLSVKVPAASVRIDPVPLMSPAKLKLPDVRKPPEKTMLPLPPARLTLWVVAPTAADWLSVPLMVRVVVPALRKRSLAAVREAPESMVRLLDEIRLVPVRVTAPALMSMLLAVRSALMVTV